MTKVKNIAVLTSGGDSPGMNAAIRAVVRTTIFHGLNAFGIKQGYKGMIEGEIIPLKSRDVSNILHRGGTILKTARSKEFRTPEGRKKAYANLKKHNIDAIVVIGGDGSFRGANALLHEFDIPVIGIPGTIDNDMYGTDYCIGYDTALNTVVEAVDKIRDTAGAHDRLFFIEVMGRDAGFIALRSGIACGAEAVLIPERKTHIDELRQYLKDDYQGKKSSGIIIVAEGDDTGGAYEIAEKVKCDYECYDIRVTVLGHIQRGGNPTAFDRNIASQMGIAAVEALLKGRKGIMVGLKNNKISFTPIDKSTKHHKEINPDLLKAVKVLNI
jgi:6-phosphofructokinase 1